MKSHFWGSMRNSTLWNKHKSCEYDENNVGLNQNYLGYLNEDLLSPVFDFIRKNSITIIWMGAFKTFWERRDK